MNTITWPYHLRRGHSDNPAKGACAAEAEAEAEAWDDYFIVLDQVISAGPQGEAWSADAVDRGTQLYRAANGAGVLVE